MTSLLLLLLGFSSIFQYCHCAVRYTRNNHETKEVLPGEKSYLISVRSKSHEHLCSGALITNNFAITAAHCINVYPVNSPDEIYIMLGTVQLGYKFCSVRNISIHENYNVYQPCQNDIALLELFSRLELESLDNIGIVSLFPRGYTLDSQDKHNVERYLATVSGYETILGKGNKSDLIFYPLFKVNSYIINQRECNISYMNEHCFIYDTQICTLNEGTSIRDAGALLVYNKTLVGIASCARNCTHLELPNLFTDVTRFVPWIESKSGLRFVHHEKFTQFPRTTPSTNDGKLAQFPITPPSNVPLTFPLYDRGEWLLK